MSLCRCCSLFRVIRQSPSLLRQVVLVIRGTTSLADALTGAVCHAQRSPAFPSRLLDHWRNAVLSPPACGL